MKVYKDINDVPSDNVALTIGNFDGVHIGHQRILQEILKECDGLPLVVMTFVPHPMSILAPGRLKLLNSYEERKELLKECGASFVVEVDFSRDFSTQGAEKFLKNYVFHCGKVQKLFLGHDFAFGQNKEGNHELALRFARENSVTVKVLDKFTDHQERVSSSLIRESLELGDVEKANHLLGRTFSIVGQVIKGVGRGKQIGFATANLKINDDRLIPKEGVYAGQVELQSQAWQAVTNVGRNPTFGEMERISVETHILDFDRDIYGETLRVSFGQRLRDEKKFSTVNELISQIQKDVESGRQWKG